MDDLDPFAGLTRQQRLEIAMQTYSFAIQLSTSLMGAAVIAACCAPQANVERVVEGTTRTIRDIFASVESTISRAGEGT